MYFLGIDAGATATQWALINQEGLVVSGSAAAMDGHLYRSSSKERMNQVLCEIALQIKDKKISGIFMGITGVTNDGSIEALATKVFAAPINVVSDIELAYRANLADGEGILLYAGTGSVAFAIDQHSKSHQIGGWGYLLGDEGAGYWIGREAIRHAMFDIEMNNQLLSGTLTSSVLDFIGGRDWSSVKAFVYSQERSVIASLSQLINSLADAGDKDASRILKKAAGHLAYLVTRMDQSLDSKLLPVKFTGGLSKSTILINELNEILPKRITRGMVNIAVRAAELAR